MKTHIKWLLKWLRSIEPANRIVTSSVRTISSLIDVQTEIAVKHLPRMGTVRQTLPNGRILTLWSRGDDWVANHIFWRGWEGYEPETARIFFSLATNAAVTLDIGAYVGYFALLAAHANVGGRVFAFEPLPEVFNRLQRNVALNDVPLVECLLTAAGEDDGETNIFHSTSSQIPSSSSLSFDFMCETPALGATRVPVTRLDTFLHHRNVRRVDLVKIDTESTEPSVLRGMMRTLKRDRPDLVCEVLQGQDTGPAIERLLQPLGYQYYRLRSSGPEPRSRIEGDATWRNYLFTVKPRNEIAALAIPTHTRHHSLVREVWRCNRHSHQTTR